MMENSVTEDDPNCGFCLQKLTYMIEPKQLPCSHVFCLPCLEEDPKKDCPVCRQEYDAEWTGMKPYSPVNEQDQHGSSANTHHIQCDICEDQKAVCYCVECEQKLCDEHYKIHERYRALSAAKHKHIDLGVYLLNLERYTPRPCPVHEDKGLTTACYNCRQIFCILCKPDLSSCPSERAQFPSNSKLPYHSNRPARAHDMAQLSMIAANMRSGVNAQLKEISDRITQGLYLEKKVWNQLHEIECDVQSMMTEVDKTVEEMVKVLQENAEKLKAGLEEYQKRCTETVEAYSTGLREQRDRLENLWRSVGEGMRMSHDTEVITRFKNTSEKIESCESILYEEQPDLPKMILSENTSLPDAVTAVFDSQLYLRGPSYTEIEFKKQICTETVCYSIAWSEEKIVCGVGCSLVAYNVNGSQESEISIACKGVPCVRNARSGKLAVLCNKDCMEREVRISTIPAGFFDDSIICKFKQESNGITHISMSSTHIAACDVMAQNIIIFNMEGSKIMCLGSGKIQNPYGVLLLENAVLVVDSGQQCLSKYNLDVDSDPVWECFDLKYVAGISSDKNGYLYVVSSNYDAGNKIYLISPEDDDETLALACRDEGIKLFNLHDKTPRP